MEFIWTKNEVANTSVTLYETNITLNKAACEHFEDINYVLLGRDKEKRLLAIKPITKEEVDLNIYPKMNLHKISLGKSYGRISNKNFMNDLALDYNLSYTKDKGIKYDAFFDENKHILVIQL